ncbi:MAG TPA: amidohydrolase [Saprospiraceae bacterium]|nr:amidohydrolase [Saprospiraceae bacterium]
MNRIFTVLVLLGCLSEPGITQPGWTPVKKAIASNIDEQSPDLISMSDAIWGFAETAFLESQSADVLAAYAEEQGFRVQRGVAEMPTSIVAEFGSGHPIIGILGEYDALPGLSQKSQVEKEPLVEGAPGHGCGHNLFGVASLGAATAIKDMIASGQLQGTVRFYGTPAEEKYFGKLYMARAGLFNDLDVCLDWHPGPVNDANTNSSMALIDYIIEFYGKAAHAALDPWNGRSAVDAMELYTTGLNYLREHILPTSRIHYQIEKAGDVANVVPEYARIWTRIRDPKRENMMAVYERALKIAQGASLMAEVDYKVTLMSGLHEILVNRYGANALHANMELVGPIEYTDEEQEYAKGIQRATGKPEVGLDGSIMPLQETVPITQGASTDVGDVSWMVPEISLTGATAPVGTPWHSWAVVACGGMSIGHKGMIFAAKSLALTMADLFQNRQLIFKIQEEFKERKGAYEYKPILPDAPPPIPTKS